MIDAKTVKCIYNGGVSTQIEIHIWNLLVKTLLMDHTPLFDCEV